MISFILIIYLLVGLGAVVIQLRVNHINWVSVVGSHVLLHATGEVVKTEFGSCGCTRVHHNILWFQ